MAANAECRRKLRGLSKDRMLFIISALSVVKGKRHLICFSDNQKNADVKRKCFCENVKFSFISDNICEKIIKNI